MTNALEPDMDHARDTSLMAHSVVIKLKKMGLPADYDEELARVSTDLGDIWGSHKALCEGLEDLIRGSRSWEEVGDSLVDLRASLDHFSWHLGNVRAPLTKLTRYAYRAAQDEEQTSVPSPSTGEG